MVKHYNIFDKKIPNGGHEVSNTTKMTEQQQHTYNIYSVNQGWETLNLEATLKVQVPHPWRRWKATLKGGALEMMELHGA